MMATGKDFSSSVVFPVFGSKAEMMNTLRNAIDGTLNKDELYEILYRIGNTNTSSFADPTVELAAAEAAE